jgi:hypothetical protein
MKNSLFLNIVLFFFVTFVVASFAQEQVTITTYYPAPYGIYRELRTDQMAVGSGYRATPLSNGNLIVEGSVAIGSPGITERLRVQGNVAISQKLATDGYAVACPNGWGCGVQTWDVYARASVRASQLCLGGSVGGTDTGVCKSDWSSCHRNTFTSASGTRYCPAGTYIATGPFAQSALAETSGWYLCCNINGTTFY